MPRNTQTQTLVGVLSEIVSIWIISDIGYYLLVPLFGKGIVYADHPLSMALYYLVWVGVALVAFKSLYAKWKVIDIHASTFLALVCTGAVILAYLLYVLPLFPPIHWVHPWEPPTELLLASPWYFLPKSIEILLQQLLVAAMVLGFETKGFSLRATTYWSAALFGSVHLLLVFGGSSFAYVSLFTLFAGIAGFIFPYLMLRVRNGFIYSYLLHWLFYAAVMVLLRVLFIA